MLLELVLGFLLFQVGNAQNTNRFVGQFVNNVGVQNGVEVWNGAVYYDIFNQQLLYNVANPVNPGFSVFVIKPTGLTLYGQYCSIENINGNPAITFFNFATGVLGYVRAANSAGSAWGAPLFIDTDIQSNVGLWTSLHLVNTQPAVAYMGNGNNDPYTGGGSLRYMRSYDSIGASWGPVQIIRAGRGNALYITLRTCNGNPCISWYDNMEERLYFIRATDANGQNWFSPYQTVDPSVGVGGNGVIAAKMEVNPANNIPYIVYVKNDGLIWMAVGSDTSGTTFVVNQVNSADGFQQNGLSVALAFNPLTTFPLVAYSTNTDVRVVQGANLLGSGTWQNSVLLNTDAATTPAQALSVSINVYGSPTPVANAMWYNQLDGTVYLRRLFDNSNLNNISSTFAIDNGQYPTFG